MWLLNRFIEIKFIHYSTPQCPVDNSMQPRPQSTLHFLPYPMTSSQPPLALLLNGLCCSGNPAQQHHRNTWSFLTDLLHLPTVKGHPSSTGISVLLLCMAEQHFTEWMDHTFSIHIAILFYYIIYPFIKQWTLSLWSEYESCCYEPFTYEFLYEHANVPLWVTVSVTRTCYTSVHVVSVLILLMIFALWPRIHARHMNSCQHMGGRGRSISVQG